MFSKTQVTSDHGIKTEQCKKTTEVRKEPFRPRSDTSCRKSEVLFLCIMPQLDPNWNCVQAGSPSLDQV